MQILPHQIIRPCCVHTARIVPKTISMLCTHSSNCSQNNLHCKIFPSKVGTLIFGKRIPPLTSLVDASVVGESNLLIFRPILKIASENHNFSSGSFFASSILAMLREMLSNPILKTLTCLLHCSKRQQSWLGPGVTVSILLLIFLMFSSTSARRRRITFIPLLSVLIVPALSEEVIGAEEQIFLRLMII